MTAFDDSEIGASMNEADGSNNAQEGTPFDARQQMKAGAGKRDGDDAQGMDQTDSPKQHTNPTVEIVASTNRYADYARKAARSVSAFAQKASSAAARLLDASADSNADTNAGINSHAPVEGKHISKANNAHEVSVVIAERKMAAGTPETDALPLKSEPAAMQSGEGEATDALPGTMRVIDPDGSPYDIAYKAPQSDKHPMLDDGTAHRGVRVLGFDLGDGESAVAMLDSESTVEPRMVPLGGRASMITAVGLRGGRIVVGEEASVLSGAQDVRVRFKSRYLTDPQAAFTVRQFAQGVLAELMRTEPGLMAQVTRTVVGCPAGWGEGRRTQYASLLESAGFPNVCVVPEPRAAFLYARHARGLRVDANLMRESAIVIDIGSSTTDFAYIVDGHQQDQSLFGDANLGGGLLDELILEESINHSPDARELRAVMEKSKAWKSYCELEARRLKERYFEDEARWRTESICSQVIVCYDQTLMLDMELNGRIIDKLIGKPIAALGERSFIDCLRDSLRAAQEVSAACPPQVVILTGGASRMAFFRQACMEAFGAALMVLCPEPECSIARGLAYAGRVDENLRVFRQEVASLAHGTRLSEAVNGRIYKLYGPLASTLYDIAKGCAMEAIGLWRSGAIATLEEMEDFTTKRIVEAFSGDEAREQIEPVLRDWMNGLIGELEGELSALCVRCGVPPEHMSLSSTHVDVGLEHVDLALSDAMGMDMLSRVLGVVLAVIGASLCGGGGVALVSTGPIGLIVGALAGAMIAMLGKSNMENAVRKVKLPMLVRKLVRDSTVLQGLERKRDQVESAIVQALADPRNGLAARLSASLGETLGLQMEEMARGAEMSIQA